MRKAADNKDMTRAGLLNAVRSLESVDYEGMLPQGAGSPDDGVFRQSLIYKPDGAQGRRPAETHRHADRIGSS